MSRILLALGGNAINRSDQKGTYAQQYENLREVSRQVAELIREGNQILITHGNGPQVGALLIQQDEAKDIVPEQPLDVLDAMTQGQIGYMIQFSLKNELRKAGIGNQVVTMINMVEVDRGDEAFGEPTKPIGPFYTEKAARKISLLKGWTIKGVMHEGKESFRHVVPSPRPLRNLEEGVIRSLLDRHVIVVASGGGGIPVTDEDGSFGGIEAVIDKDLAGELLAEDVGADVLMLMTDVERVKLNYGKEDERDLDVLNVEEAERHLREGQFPPGSMGPKIEAAIKFVRGGGRIALISSTERIIEAYRGMTGTRIVR